MQVQGVCVEVLRRRRERVAVRLDVAQPRVISATSDVAAMPHSAGSAEVGHA
jgi:hypothetical protein